MAVDISVIIPTFRRPAQLLEAIGSALSQEGVSVELFVHDDSPEGSAEAAVLALKDPRVRYRRRKVPSQGRPATVRNDGARDAQGRYVHFLDDDDLVARGAYRAFVGALDAAPRKGMAFGRVEPFGEDPDELRRQQLYFRNASRRARLGKRLDSRRFMAANMLFKDTMLVNSACLIRRECIEPLGGYNAEVPVVEDVDFFLRAMRRFGFLFLDRVVLHYRTGAPSLMHDQADRARVAKSYEEIFRTYRAEHGALELFALRVAARSLLWWL